MLKKINNYQILSKIASGGMSEVYLADDLKTGKKVALKILDAKLSIDPEYLHRFRKEASISQQLDHKNIVKILSFGTFKENYYIAYEYINGITLDKYTKSKILSIDEIENLSIQILNGLSFAHSKNIIHRDIKPSNIMIEDGTVKILDFGIAKQELSATVTKTGLFMGSPHYVSPEQIEGHDIDYRSDIYSFGVVLYEMIEGKVPFSADTPWGIIRAHLDKKVPEITKDTPFYLKEVVIKCLSKSKEDRFKSANEIISVIKNKEGIGKRTVIIKNEWEKLEKILEKENSIDELKGKNTGEREFLKPFFITIISILFIGILAFVIIVTKNINNTNISQAVPNTTAIETTTQTIQTTTTHYETTTTQYHSTTTTSYSNQKYENDLAEEKFLNKMSTLLDEYNSVVNHINTYGGKKLNFGEPNSIEFEGSVLARYQELSNKLRNFSCPSSYKNDKNNLIGVADAICFYQNEVVEINKNGSYEAYVNSFNVEYQKISDLFNYNKSMINAHNKKYH